VAAAVGIARLQHLIRKEEEERKCVSKGSEGKGGL